QNFFKAKAKGGAGGDGGNSTNGPGGGGGKGGDGQKTQSGGRIEATPTGQGQGGSGGSPGTGTTPGSSGAPGADESGALISDIPEGDADGDGIADPLDPCPEDASIACQPSGRCDVQGICVQATQSQCGLYGGTYGGDGSACPEPAPRTCLATDAEGVTTATNAGVMLSVEPGARGPRLFIVV